MWVWIFFYSSLKPLMMAHVHCLIFYSISARAQERFTSLLAERRASYASGDLTSLAQLSPNPLNPPHIVLNQLQTLQENNRRPACGTFFAFFSSWLSFCVAMNGLLSLSLFAHVCACIYISDSADTTVAWRFCQKEWKKFSTPDGYTK